MTLAIRLPVASEHPFVYAALIRSSAAYVPAKVYRSDDGKGPLRTKWMDRKAWTDLLGRRVEQFLMRNQVSVAEAEGALVGFVCAGPLAIHYVYTEGKFRRRGVASEMLRRCGLSRETPQVITHWTPLADLFFASATWNEGMLE